MKRLVVASTNAGKIREVSLALSDLPDWNVESLPDLPEIEETGNTFLENATLKASHYSRFIGDLTLADDSGLCVDAIGGRPGLHSARYAPTTEERNDKLLAELHALGEDVDRVASFYCAFAVARGRHGDLDRADRASGPIALVPRGGLRIWVRSHLRGSGCRAKHLRKCRRPKRTRSAPGARPCTSSEISCSRNKTFRVAALSMVLLCA